MENKIKYFAVCGSPILHSKSPDIFTAAYGEILPGSQYLRISADSAGDAVQIFQSLGLSGMNVTAPFKKEIMACLDLVDSEAESIGAVNTIIAENGMLKAYNTDYTGVINALSKNKVDINNKTVIVLGAGNAARAAIYGLKKYTSNITVVNRTFGKALTCAETFSCVACQDEKLPDIVRNADILISTIPSDNIAPLIQLASKELVILDAIYKSSALETSARENNIKYISGREWLINQAVPAFSIFTGIEPDVNRMESGFNNTQTQQNILLTGFMGAGKSSIGKELSAMTGYDLIDTDELIEQNEQLSIPEIFSSKGEEYFRKKESEILNEIKDKIKGEDKRFIIALGGGIILDGSNREIIKELGLTFWVYSDIDESIARIGERPLLRDKDIDKAEKLFETRKSAYSECSGMILYNKSITGAARRIKEEFENL